MQIDDNRFDDNPRENWHKQTVSQEIHVQSILPRPAIDQKVNKQKSVQRKTSREMSFTVKCMCRNQK